MKVNGQYMALSLSIALAGVIGYPGNVIPGLSFKVINVSLTGTLVDKSQNNIIINFVYILQFLNNIILNYHYC
jgi:hypothetical protein